jgi:type IV pilus assembly protein PilC
MKVFAYRAKDNEGAQVNGKIEAADKSSAIRFLKEKNLFILSLDEKDIASSIPAAIKESVANLFYHVKSEDLMILTRELATMISSGFPLLSSIEILLEDIKNPTIEEILLNISSRIKGGASFSECLEQFPHVFPRIYINLVKAGEASGEIDKTLLSLASYLENTERIKRKIQGALLYPVILLLTTIAILVIFFIVAIPKFKEIYDIFGSELPMATKLFLHVSALLRDNFIFIVLGLVALILCLKLLLATAGGKRWWAGAQLVLPLLREIYLKIAVSRLCRTLAVLYSSGVPLLESFSLVAKVVDNIIMQETVVKMAASVHEGESIAQPLKQSKLFPSIAIHMIDVGEKSGTLDKMLNKIADLYDFQVETWINSLTAMLEPFLVIFLGFLIGFLVIVMALPIMRLPAILR